MVRYAIAGIALGLVGGVTVEVARAIGWYPWGVLIASLLVMIDLGGLYLSRPRPT